MVFLVALLPMIALVALAVSSFSAGHVILGGIAVAGVVILFTLISLVSSALSTILLASLYLYASEGTVPSSVRREVAGRGVSSEIEGIHMSHIVADGRVKLNQNEGYRSRLRELHESIRANYAVDFAEAGFFRRLVLRWRIAAEYRQERRRTKPSPQSLFSRHPGIANGSDDGCCEER